MSSTLAPDAVRLLTLQREGRGKALELKGGDTAQ